MKERGQSGNKKKRENTRSVATKVSKEKKRITRGNEEKQSDKENNSWRKHELNINKREEQGDKGSKCEQEQGPKKRNREESDTGNNGSMN